MSLTACCKNPDNRVVVPLPPETLAQAATRGGIPGKQQCRVCGNFHYTLQVDPVHYGMQGSPLGQKGSA